ncbi:MAG TPA: type VI secretion system tube protein Hcp [Pseudonocardiaceae bacterium]|nr:type VI secretion system tube protein Hcp [Pseudonocardiaceae bacterium]
MPIYLSLDQIQGDVTAEGYVDQIELMSFSHGLSHPQSTTDGVSGKLSVAEIAVTKTTDRASVRLIEAAVLGKVFDKAQIAFVSTDRDMLVAYLVVDLSNTRVSSAAISSGGDRPVEQLSLACEQIRWAFVEPGAREAVTFGWDLLNQKALPS